ncbi:MAG TPA: LysM peptidoglycan-binding domain-containing protein [Planctomycetota bacterium]|nr:LysM peptidoglycan-binding domain-containing protein [Planctomycetota bacterium]
MNDVEKYGLFAVIFIGGLLLVIGLQGGFSSAPKVAPVVIGGDVPPVAAVAPVAAQSAGNRVRVKSIMPETSFDWTEPPIAYPGERASALPGAADEGTPLSVVAPAGAPVAAAPAAPAASAPAPVVIAAPAGMHVVAKDETLSSIAARYLGSESRWKDLVKLNPGLDPRKLKIGTQIRVSGEAEVADARPAKAPAAKPVTPLTATPDKPAAAAAPVARAAGRTHTVVKGDTLGAIAKTYLGSTAKADELYTANKDVLKSKDDLKLGQVLRIP